MAWRVGIVLDEVHNTHDLDLLVRQMPVWAVDTLSRQLDASKIRTSARQIWGNEPAFTLFQRTGAANQIELLRNIIDMIVEHHPCATCLDLIGIDSTPVLAELLLPLEFVPGGMSAAGVRFCRPIERLANVPELRLDASRWASFDDVYDSFFAAVGAPPWHGRNFNALNDSISTGGINAVEVPYLLIIEHLDVASAEGFVVAQEFIEFVRELESGGCPVSVTVRG